MPKLKRVLLAPLVLLLSLLGVSSVGTTAPATAQISEVEAKQPAVLLLDSGRHRSLWRKLAARHRVYAVPSWLTAPHRVAAILAAIEEDQLIVVGRSRAQLDSLYALPGSPTIVARVPVVRTTGDVAYAHYRDLGSHWFSPPVTGTCVWPWPHWRKRS